MKRKTVTRCGHRPMDGERLVSDLALSVRETTILQMSRCFFQSFAEPKSHGWLYAHRLAAVELPEHQAPAILCATLEMIQGLRVSRKSIFRFSNPFCACCSQILTPHERLLVSTLAAFIAGNADAAKRHATLLCEGNEMEEFLRCCRALAQLVREPVAQH